MSTIAYVLRTDQPVPDESDREWWERFGAWVMEIQDAWYDRLEEMPDEEEQQARGLFSRRLNSISVGRSHPGDRACARAWVDEVYEAWLASGRVAPARMISLRLFSERTGAPAGAGRLGFNSIVHSTVECPSLKSRAGVQRLVANRADPFDLRLSLQGAMGGLLELVHVYGGEAVMLATCGGAVSVCRVAAGQEGLLPPMVSFRKDAPWTGRARRGMRALKDLFEGSELAPDWEALEAQLAAPSIQIDRWFAAFSVAGAKEGPVVDPDVWEHLDAVASAFISGQKVPAASRKALRGGFAACGIKPAMPRAAKKPTPRTSRAVAELVTEAREALGDPEPPWTGRFAAADLFGGINDELPEFLAGRGAVAESAVVAFHLGRVPAAVRRDRLYLSLAAEEAEGWNNDVACEALHAMAVAAELPGFSVVAFEDSAGEAFSERFGVFPLEHDGWACVVLAGTAGAQDCGPVEEVRAWLAEQGTGGLVATLPAHGRCEVVHYPKATGDRAAAKKLTGAAEAFDPRAAIAALSLPLMFPAEARPEAASRRQTVSEDARQAVAAALEHLPEAVEIPCPAALAHHVGTLFVEVALSIHAPGCDLDGWAEQVAADLRRVGVRRTWIEDGRIRAHVQGDEDPTPIIAVLGDLPAGATIAMAPVPDDTWTPRPSRPLHFRICPT